MKRKTKKYERFLILLKAVGNAHYVDKSRPYIQWTLADLFTDVIQNFLHSEKVNKSQTRIKSICHRFFTLSEPAVILKWRCKDSNKFWYMQIFLLFWWKKLKIFITNASFNQYVIARRYARFSCLTSRRGTICYIVFYLLFSNPVLVLCLSRTCPVLILYLYCTCSVLVRYLFGFRAEGYILVNNSSVVNSILAKANRFCFKCPRNLRWHIYIFRVWSCKLWLQDFFVTWYRKLRCQFFWLIIPPHRTTSPSRGQELPACRGWLGWGFRYSPKVAMERTQLFLCPSFLP